MLAYGSAGIVLQAHAGTYKMGVLTTEQLDLSANQILRGTMGLLGSTFGCARRRIRSGCLSDGEVLEHPHRDSEIRL